MKATSGNAIIKVGQLDIYREIGQQHWFKKEQLPSTNPLLGTQRVRGGNLKIRG
jgi:hypothetical protein